MRAFYRARGAWILGVLFLLLPSCSTWYSSVHQESDGQIVITGNRRAGLLAGGPEAQLWVGTYDATTKTLTLQKAAAE
ncbi:MAG: hypothetical protein RL885_10605 [Planctomycetota bacterium]